MQAGKCETACPALDASEKLDPRPGTLFTLAECQSKWGHVATAVTLYDNYISQIALLPIDKQQLQEERKEIALEQKAALAPSVPQLTIVVPAGAPPGMVVKRDQVDVAPAAIGVPLPVDPGDHVVSTDANGRHGEVHVTIALREHKSVTVALPWANTGPSLRRIGAYVAGGVGGAALLTGAILGGVTIAKRSVIHDHCNFPSDPNACDTTGLAAASSAKGLGIGSSVMFAVAAAGIGTGLALYFTEPKRAAGSVAVDTLEVAPLPDGGAFAVRGTF